MNIRKILISILIVTLLGMVMCASIYADNNSTSPGDSTRNITPTNDVNSGETTVTNSVTTIPDSSNTTVNSTTSEEWLDKEIEFTSIIEVKQGTTVAQFIEQEKERRLKEWYGDKIAEGYEVVFGEGAVYAINGTTNRADKTKLNNTDLIRTNSEVEIGVSFTKDGGNPVPNTGEGEMVGIVVIGDITGTGEIDVTDLSSIQEEIVETTELKGNYKKAADMDKSGDIDVIDLSELQEYIVNN